MMHITPFFTNSCSKVCYGIIGIVQLLKILDEKMENILKILEVVDKNKKSHRLTGGFLN